jgi:hypothetical protein
MHDDPSAALDGVIRRSKTLAATAARVAARRDRLDQDLGKVSAEITSLNDKAQKLILTGELLRSLMDLLVTEQIQVIEKIVTDGLRSIFFDQELSFKAGISTKYNKISIDFTIQRGEGPLAISGKPIESFGGGPTSIASLLLRILTLLRLKRRPVLFLDETLSAVSDEYVEPTGRFLAELARTSGVDVLLVTHKQSFLDHASAAYQGAEADLGEGVSKLVVKRLRSAS